MRITEVNSPILSAVKPESKMNKIISVRIFGVLMVTYGVLTGISVFLPQGVAGASIPSAPMPAPLFVMALIAAGVVLVAYGGLGALGLFCARKLALPEIWDAAVSNRQRFIVPALAGLAVGVILILGDILFSPINGLGHFPHPPFPTSIVAALAAGIGEEVLFRLFFISFWAWLISRVILRGRAQGFIYAAVSTFSAVVFGLSHLPSLMYLKHWNSMAQIPPTLLLELLSLNGLMALVAASFFRKYGFLAPVGVHFWADVVWHMIWGVL